LVLTSKPGDATRLAEEGARAGRGIVVVGGDGAINEAGNGLLRAGAPTPLGVVPAGSGNDYATGVARMPGDLAAALEIALTAPPVRVDAARVNTSYALNAVGVGIDANCTATATKLKRYGLSGVALYMTAALSEILLRYNNCPTLDTEFDDGPATHGDYAAIAMSIGPTYGGGFKVNPSADPQDGRLTVCAITKPSQMRALKLLPMVEHGKHIGEPETTVFTARKIILDSPVEIYAQLDGELIRGRHFEVESLPGALWLRRA
jgi:diacylglycerol kinase (ATP)